VAEINFHIKQIKLIITVRSVLYGCDCLLRVAVTAGNLDLILYIVRYLVVDKEINELSLYISM
jgi:hypothetical protein